MYTYSQNVQANFIKYFQKINELNNQPVSTGSVIRYQP